ncbi:MAG TPA: 16S rRNA (cytosine(1402)-N(4))-methyltransferase, partial [Tepidisphaeraceae bacterium]|nr:16S rRNA (cytosine(1402)-N(4))-methyltransferase [Tepidisphaeraceae bacterium]
MRDVRHIPVLPAAVLDALRPQPGQTVVDCTLGLGGHAALLLERVLPGGRVIGTDFDPAHV